MRIKNYKDYDFAVARREEIESLLDKAYGIAFHLQDMYNDIDESIINYDEEQAALDE